MRESMGLFLSQSFTRIALVADSEMPHLVSLYKSLGVHSDQKPNESVVGKPPTDSPKSP